MSEKHERPVTSRLNLPLLRSESTDDYLGVLERLIEGIKPRGIVEQVYVEDLAALVFEIRRLQHAKLAIIQNARLPALRNLLKLAADSPRWRRSTKHPNLDELALDWFTKEPARRQVAKMLGWLGLEESAIDAEAIRVRMPDVEVIDRMLSIARSRFDRSLRCLSDYQEAVAPRLRQACQPMLPSDEVAILEYQAEPASVTA